MRLGKGEEFGQEKTGGVKINWTAAQTTKVKKRVMFPPRLKEYHLAKFNSAQMKEENKENTNKR